MSKAAIIIVNWNGLKFLKDCLTAVYKQTYKNFQVYFVDNGSHDGSRKYVKDNFPKAKIIPLKENTGFAKGNNIGIKKAFKDKIVEYIVCLNNDTIVDKEWLKELIRTAENNIQVGAVGSVALYPGGKIQTAGIKIRKDFLLSEDHPGQMSLGYNQSKVLFTKEMPIFAPTGATVLYPRSVLEKVGLFDEDFFAYCEDIDLGFRINNQGYKCFLSPKSRLIHFHSKTGGIASEFKAFYSKRNAFFVAIKNYPPLQAFLFPFKDFVWNISKFFSKKDTSSVNKFRDKNGGITLLWVMTKVYLSVMIYFTKILIKRFKDKKE